MKKVLLIAMVLVLAFSFVACGNSYGKIKSAFEKEGYVEQQIETGSDYKKWQEELKEEGIEFTVHHLQKDALIGKKDVVILEFKNVDGIKETLTGDNEIAETMKFLLKTLDTSYEEIYDGLTEAGLVNGNCLFIVSDVLYLAETIEIFKNA